VLNGAADDQWVYKTPAIIDALLLTPVTWRSIRPVTPWKRRVFELCVERPADFWNNRVNELGVTTAAHASGKRRWVTEVGKHVACRSAAMTNRLSAAWARAGRRRRFRRMCQILQRITRERLFRVVLPFEILEAACILHAKDTVLHYRGLVLKQRRADFFFEYFDALDRFDWAAPQRVQHELWRHGIGLVDVDEVLGPRNWALLDGEILLADTGSLTEDFSAVRRVLSDELLNERQWEIPSWWPHHVSGSLPRYFAYVRQQVNQDQLHRMWRTAYDNHASSGRSSVNLEANYMRWS
jgi:hypothetical protein